MSGGIRLMHTGETCEKNPAIAITNHDTESKLQLPNALSDAHHHQLENVKIDGDVVEAMYVGRIVDERPC